MSQSINPSNQPWWKPTGQFIGTGVAVTTVATSIYKINEDREIKRADQMSKIIVF